MQYGNFLFDFVVVVVTAAIVHLVFEIFTRRTTPLKALDMKQMLPPVKHTATKAGPLKVALTGGTGFLGRAIVQRFVAVGHKVVVIDLNVPPQHKRVRGVEYRRFNIVTGRLQQLVEYLDGCDAVCHTAGIVSLADDHGLLFNVHVVGTQRVIRAARLAGVPTLLHTSSSATISSPYVTESSQQNIPSDFRVPPNWEFFSHYSATKSEAERLVLQSNDDSFRTAALRLPAIYGVGDTLMVDALASGTMTFVPGGDDSRPVLTDFCYVHNAAHAHVLAIEALVDDSPGVAGKTFNVSNGEPRDPKQMWNGFLKQLGIARKVKPTQLFRMPYGISLGIACMSEFLFWFFAGRVPFPRHAFWNFTRSSLDIIQVSITLDISETRSVLGYEPLYTNDESIEEIVAVLTKPAEKPKKAKPLPVKVGSAVIDWAPRPLSSSFLLRSFETLSGPGSSLSELLITAIGAVCGVALAQASTSSSWTSSQKYFSSVFGLINGAAVLQCTMPTSKRWYHEGGKLSMKAFVIIVVEVVVQVFLLVFLYQLDTEELTLDIATRVCKLLIPAITAIYLTDIQVQLAVGLLLCGGLTYWFLVVDNRSLDPHMAWAIPLLCVKYLVSHVPRREPYN